MEDSTSMKDTLRAVGCMPLLDAALKYRFNWDEERKEAGESFSPAPPYVLQKRY